MLNVPYVPTPQPPRFLSDGYTSFAGGQDEGSLPDRINPTQLRRAVNISFREKAIQPRYGYRYQWLTFDKEFIEGRPVETIFRTGKFQMTRAYRTATSVAIIVIVSGIIFRVEPNTGRVTVLHSKDGQRLNQFRRRYNGVQAGRFFVIFDFPNTPLIIDGLVVRRSDTKRTLFVAGSYLPLPEVLASVDGIFAGNRLWVRVGNQYTAGDPVGGIGGADGDAPITFEEVLVPATPFYKQAFSLGFANAESPITGFAVLQSIDSSTGIGSLLISTAETIFAANISVPRSTWGNQVFAQPILFGAGLAGPRAGANLNSDYLFVGTDQTARALSMARDEQHKWSNSPISNEVGPLLRAGDKELVGQSFVETFRGYGFFGAMPHRVEAVGLQGQPVFDEVHDGFAILELDSVTNLGTPPQPIWAGLWTGIRPMEAVKVEDRFFVMSKDVGNINQLYEVDPSLTYDVYKDQEVAIPTRLYTRDFDWQTPNVLKREQSVNYDIADVVGKLAFSVAKKRSVDQGYQHWGNGDFEVREGFLDVESDKMKTLAPHGMEALNLGDPVSDPICDPLTGDALNTFKKASLRVDIRAKNFVLKTLIFEIQPIQDTAMKNAPCKTTVVESEVVPEEYDDVDFYFLSRDYGTAY